MRSLSKQDVHSLLSQFSRWRLEDDGQALLADLEFSDFAEAWSFMNEVARYAEDQAHHPEWSNVYNRVRIRLTTHDAAAHGAVTERDETLLRDIERILAGMISAGPTAAGGRP